MTRPMKVFLHSELAVLALTSLPALVCSCSLRNELSDDRRVARYCESILTVVTAVLNVCRIWLSVECR